VIKQLAQYYNTIQNTHKMVYKLFT